MVSSHMPKEVPPRLNRIISTGIRRISFPPSRRMTLLTPASMAPVLITTPRKPPTIKMNSATSAAS